MKKTKLNAYFIMQLGFRFEQFLFYIRACYKFINEKFFEVNGGNIK